METNHIFAGGAVFGWESSKQLVTLSTWSGLYQRREALYFKIRRSKREIVAALFYEKYLVFVGCAFWI